LLSEISLGVTSLTPQPGLNEESQICQFVEALQEF
jgi:hypothetical protein